MNYADVDSPILNLNYTKLYKTILTRKITTITN